MRFSEYVKKRQSEEYFKFILSNYQIRRMNWYDITSSKYIFPEQILSNMHLPWEFSHISLNPNINFKVLEEYPQLEKYIDWEMICANEGISFEELEKHPKVIMNGFYLSFLAVLFNPL